MPMTTAFFQIEWIHFTDSMLRKIPAIIDNIGGQLKFQSVQYNELWSY